MDGCNGQDEGRHQCRLDRGEVMLVRPGPEERSREEKRHRGAPEGRACRKARGHRRKVPKKTCAISALRPPHGGMTNPGAARDERQMELSIRAIVTRK